MVKVLIVEDDIAMQQIFSEVLRIDGHTILCSGDGEDAIKQLNTHLPDVLLLDINLPKLSGYDLIHYIHDAGVYHHMKTIIVTASNNFVNSPEADMVDIVMLKPISMPQLRKMVSRLTGIKLTQIFD